MPWAEDHTTISDRTWQGQQSWDRQVTRQYQRPRRDPATLRVHSHRDGYDPQSFATVDYWNGSGWATVLRVPAAELNIAGLSYVSSREKFVAATDLDLDGLLDEARAVVGC